MATMENNNIRVDRAWNRLHSRLEQDGLLKKKEESQQHLFRPVALKWAASLLILVTASIFIARELNPTLPEMLTLLNSEKNSTFVTTLEDGSVVYLAENTSLSYPEHFQKNSREVFLEGDAFFEISKNPESPFIIETDLIKVKVLGTSFNVKAGTKGYPSLSVNTGVVEVTLKNGGESTKINAGETVIIHSGNLEVIPTSDLEQFTLYMSRIHFKDERLADVIRVINRNYEDMFFEISPEVEERLLTATFSQNSPDSLAELICSALNLKYSKEQNTIKIYK
ncbi:MAG TPA: anti-sigma factor [Rikenellaceae bacterium]|nr:anti-sigma factor [Rikenellaceae bacterium]